MQPELLHFDSDGIRLTAWLYRPAGPGPHPLIVLAHGYSATHSFHYWRTAEAFAAEGMAVLDFDGRNLGASGGEPRQVIRVGEQIRDVREALAFARTLDGIDHSRIGLYGSSLGGGFAIEAAASDPHLAALVLVVPFVNGMTNLPKASMQQRLWLIGNCLADRVGRALGRAPRTIQVFGKEGDRRSVIACDDCWQAMMEEAEPGGEWVEPGMTYLTQTDEFTNRVTAWEILEQLRFRPGRRLTSVTAPIFMTIGTKDTVTPVGPQRRAGKAAKAEIFERPFNHFDPFRKAVAFDETHAAQVVFLNRIFAAKPA